MANPSPRTASGAPPADRQRTRDRFLEATAELLQRQGYAATGLAQITAAAGVPRGSLYFHFPQGKEQLGAEALSRSGAQIARRLDASLESAPDAGGVVRALVGALSAGLQSSGYELGCPIASTALEQTATSTPIREAAQDTFGRWLEILRVGLQADGREPAVAEEQALFVLSAVEGALLLARAARSTRPLRVVSQQLVDHLGASPGHFTRIE